MKTEIRNGCLTVKDRPLLFWAFYSSFIAGGLVALIVSVRDSPGRWATVAGAVIGIGNIAGGLFMIRKEPASIVELDTSAGALRITRWTPAGKRVDTHALSVLRQADVETSEHTDGGAVYRPRLVLEGSASIPISMFWYQRKAPSEAVACEINDFLSQPSFRSSARSA